MKTRCYNTKDKKYPMWGGRGITVCDEWRDDYIRFLSDMGTRPDNCSLERKDNDGPYAVWNCMWATPKEQVDNRRNTIFVNVNGEKTTLTAACEERGLPYLMVYKRIRKGRSETEWFLPSRYS